MLVVMSGGNIWKSCHVFIHKSRMPNKHYTSVFTNQDQLHIVEVHIVYWYVCIVKVQEKTHKVYNVIVNSQPINV